MFLRSLHFLKEISICHMSYDICHMSYDISDINSGDVNSDFSFHKSGELQSTGVKS